MFILLLGDWDEGGHGTQREARERQARRKTVNIGKIPSRTTSSPTLGSIVERLAHFYLKKKDHTGREHKRKNISLFFVFKALTMNECEE